MITLVIHSGLTVPPLSRILRLVWLIGLAAVIVGSLAPAQSGVMHLIDLGGVNDKVEHFSAYAVLAALPNLHGFRCRRTGAAMVVLFLLGAALELGQLFSPGRTCDWHDLLANSCGILAGLALVRILQRFTFNSAANGLR
jgi:VanZ family protein